MRHATWILTAFLLAGWGDCHDDTQVCVPRTSASCYCATGELGQRVCEAEGERYGACECLPDAGVEESPPPDEPEQRSTTRLPT